MRYALLYVAHFLAFGSHIPYLPLYLRRHAGLERSEIGWVLATIGLAGVVGPFLWGPLVDHTNKRRLILGVGFAMTGILYPAYMFVRSLPSLFILTVVFGAMLAPLVPLMDDLTLRRVRTRGGDYGRMRLWGSLSFILGSMAVGWLLDRGLPSAQFVLFCLAEAAALLVVFSFPANDINYRAARHRDLHFWRALSGTFVLFLVAAFLGKVSTIGHSTFYSLYLETIGANDSLKGIAWSIGVVAEIAMMVVAGGIVRRFGAHRLFLVGLVGSAARFLLYALWPTITGALVGQVFHAFSFGAFHIGSVTLASELSPPGRSGTGQLALAALASGLGASVGSLISGQIAQAWGYRIMYVALAGLAILGAAVALGFARRVLALRTGEHTPTVVAANGA